MREREFRRGDRPVSEIGLGCWQLGAEWGTLTDETAREILATAVAEGITFFDTADVYGRGLSERRIGAFLRETRAEVFVATKFGRFPEPGWPANFEPDTLRRHVDASRERLGQDTLDLVQLHCLPLEVMRAGRVFDTLRELEEEGAIARFGASVESCEEALACLEVEGLASLQILFSLFRQVPRERVFERARERNVALIARVPFASGLLTGRLTRERRFPEDDHRNFNRDGASFHVGETFGGLPFEKGLSLVDELRALLPPDRDLAEIALRFILDHPEITTVIPGATRPEQVRRNALASEAPALDEERMERLRTFHDEKVQPHVRGAV